MRTRKTFTTSGKIRFGALRAHTEQLSARTHTHTLSKTKDLERATARGDPVQAVEARAPRARAAGVGREGEGAGGVRSGRQRREGLRLVNERWEFLPF